MKVIKLVKTTYGLRVCLDQPGKMSWKSSLGNSYAQTFEVQDYFTFGAKNQVVYTRRGWIEAQYLVIGDELLVEGKKEEEVIII